MAESMLLADLVANAATRCAHRVALTSSVGDLSYGELHQNISACASGLVGLGLGRGERIAIYLDKRFETVVASFGACAAGMVFVPINPVLKPEQVMHILRDCGVSLLLSTPERLRSLGSALNACEALRYVVHVGPSDARETRPAACQHMAWEQLLGWPPRAGHRVIDADMAAILYTSGSTGRPKGVVLSHRNLVVGAKSVSSYLGNNEQDVLLAALPLSFDAGFSQLTTAFHVGAKVVLLNYLLPRDLLISLAEHRVTGLTAVPPLYMQLAQLEWPKEAVQHLRYFANTGGRMPRVTLDLLRKRLPASQPFLMYGLTEAFRSTFLAPSEVDRRPDSIGKAIPNAEVLVLREDGSECADDEPGELVHRGALVGMGYWGDAAGTAERYRPLPSTFAGRGSGLCVPEYAVFSGDSVRRDSDGFLYFLGRKDEMIKTSGYRVSPTEVEEVLYASQLVAECAAFGVEHATLGQAIQVCATAVAPATELDVSALLQLCRQHLPAYMVPAGFELWSGPLPRNPNGKIDRKTLAARWHARQGRTDASVQAQGASR
ncbi:acyl-CoA ligase (AMP-forming), exosortase A system-associated [Roseateles toxinivorans]|uniref:Acyl-CoA ligase (AMP-forming) (Exosortase A-associated) n=1 Tax=Roseateles toxinivorans TaxID=270368 RepID=A0A4R6QTC0_9BURK|nr:acyl-CoA ligase (AMP-forming), exosortase A system-associated [Roseateles toxinivorans]TDP74627.1 acyl-CoA ligase (AMP-forming) (exosortase A-associated) [Roseateles toxinivorans]